MTAPKVVGTETIKVLARNHKNPQMLDLDELTLRAGRHYRWVRCRADEKGASVMKHKLKGYIPETKENGVKTLVDPDDRPDNVIAIGDMILMSCPIGEYHRRRAERRQLNDAKMAATTAVTKQMAKEKGVKVISDSDDD